jgi:hypothetical protein
MKILAHTIFVAIFFVLVIFASMPISAFAQVPFGGPITSIIPCDEGLELYLGPPTPGSFMYSGGSVSFAYGPPTHVGQFLLGVASGFLLCTVGGTPIGGGLLILYHGSSI